MSGPPGWGEFCQPPSFCELGRDSRGRTHDRADFGALSRIIHRLTQDELEMLVAVFALGEPERFEYYLRQISYERSERVA